MWPVEIDIEDDDSPWIETAQQETMRGGDCHGTYSTVHCLQIKNNQCLNFIRFLTSFFTSHNITLPNVNVSRTIIFLYKSFLMPDLYFACQVSTPLLPDCEKNLCLEILALHSLFQDLYFEVPLFPVDIHLFQTGFSWVIQRCIGTGIHLVGTRYPI